jgi:hypothetical protein
VRMERETGLELARAHASAVSTCWRPWPKDTREKHVVAIGSLGLFPGGLLKPGARILDTSRDEGSVLSIDSLLNQLRCRWTSYRWCVWAGLLHLAGSFAFQYTWHSTHASNTRVSIRRDPSGQLKRIKRGRDQSHRIDRVANREACQQAERILKDDAGASTRALIWVNSRASHAATRTTKIPPDSFATSQNLLILGNTKFRPVEYEIALVSRCRACRTA